jgi:hypothetical protein
MSRKSRQAAKARAQELRDADELRERALEVTSRSDDIAPSQASLSEGERVVWHEASQTYLPKWQAISIDKAIVNSRTYPDAAPEGAEVKEGVQASELFGPLSPEDCCGADCRDGAREQDCSDCGDGQAKQDTTPSGTAKIAGLLARDAAGEEPPGEPSEEPLQPQASDVDKMERICLLLLSLLERFAKKLDRLEGLQASNNAMERMNNAEDPPALLN